MSFRRAVFAVLFLLLVRAAGAVQVVDGPRIEVQGSSAVVRWKTDAECGARVRFGTAPDQLIRGSGESAGVGLDHAVKLEGLQPGTTYYFSVGTAKKTLTTGQFKTSSKGSSSTPPATPKPDAKPPAQTAGAKTQPAPKPANSEPVGKAPPTKKIWGHLASLQDHFDRHGRDFGARNPDDYARMSWEFLQRAINDGLPAKFDDSDGTLRVWDGKTHTFAAYNRDFTTKTFFKPESPTYFERQPGKPVKLQRKQ